MRRPRDPVAAWVLRRHPKLHPSFAAPTILAMLRARADRVDELVVAAARRAARVGEPLAVVSIGGGFDARWHRLRGACGGGVARFVEVEDPEVLGFKDRLLATSTFADEWQDVERIAAPELAWEQALAAVGPSVLVMEGAAVRLGVEAIRELLRRARAAAPAAQVVLDVPGIVQPQVLPGRASAAAGISRTRWTAAAATGAASLRTRELSRLGYRVVDDEWHAARPELRGRAGLFVCGGVEALRVLRLAPV